VEVNDNGIGDGGEGVVVTLGNGVDADQAAVESTVAVAPNTEIRPLISKSTRSPTRIWPSITVSKPTGTAAT